MSTSPTFMSWRRKSSVRTLSSANVISVRSTAVYNCKDTHLYLYYLLKFVAAETSKTGRVPWLTDTAGRLLAETYSCRTSRSEYFLCSAAYPVLQPAPCLKDC